MEKIYMENNQKQNKQSIFQQIFKAQLSKKLSIAMVFVSFLSFMLIGITNVSYAAVAPIPEDEGLGESFTTATAGTEVIGSGFSVTMYATTSNIPIFCLERDVNFQANTLMNKSEQITDQGLLYVMANSFPHVKFKNDNGEEFPDEVQTWITQVAIWEYLYEIGAANNVNGDLSAAKSVAELYWDANDDDDPDYTCSTGGCNPGMTAPAGSGTFFDKYVAPLVANARQSDVSANGTITLTIANQEISVTEDEKYYQSALVTASATNTGSLVPDSLKITVESAPDGTVIVDENGQVVDENTAVTKFYVRVPVDSVTEDNKVVKLSATGTFRGYDGYYYKADGAQTVSTVFTTDVPSTTGLEIPINYTPEVPNTSMNLAQSIYFVGLIVLLCGIGIIYANAKPKAKQQ